MTLDLSQVDPPIWRVLIKDTAYGPYTLGQMQSFISEGRIGLQTKVAKGDGEQFVAAEMVKDLQESLRQKHLKHPKSRTSDKTETPHNYIIISRLTGTGEASLLQRLNTFGSFGQAMPGVYVLRSKAKLSVIQQTLQRATTARDELLIVDATANRLGWFNLGPEADVHLRSIWDKQIN